MKFVIKRHFRNSLVIISSAILTKYLK